MPEIHVRRCVYQLFWDHISNHLLSVIKEWAILAIRNLLENNAENQKLIQQLTSMGKVKSDVLKEFEPEKGFLRLQ